MKGLICRLISDDKGDAWQGLVSKMIHKLRYCLLTITYHSWQMFGEMLNKIQNKKLVLVLFEVSFIWKGTGWKGHLPVCNCISDSVRENITHYFARMQLSFLWRLPKCLQWSRESFESIVTNPANSTELVNPNKVVPQGNLQRYMWES